MKTQRTVDIVGEEVRRLQEEVRALDSQIDELTAQRNRCQMLISILQAHQGLKTRPPKPLREQASDEGLKAIDAEIPRRTRKSMGQSQTLQVGQPARMIEGIYAGLTGVIRWCRQTPRGMICTLSLRNAAGRVVRTQVTERSLGKKWEVLSAPGETPQEVQSPPPTAAPSKAPGRRKSRKAAPRSSTGPRRATRPETLLPRNTPVRVLKGKYAGWEGLITGIRDKGTAITYALNLKGPGGEDGRTQVNHGSLGDSWVLVETPGVPREESAPSPPKVLRRRRSEAMVPVADGNPDQESAHAAEVTEAKAQEGPDTSSAKTAAQQEPLAAASPGSASGNAIEALVRYTPSSPILAEGTRIRMLSGPHLGLTGIIAKVQQHPGPRTEAIYTILIETGPDGDTVVTSARHSSLGRSWTVL